MPKKKIEWGNIPMKGEEYANNLTIEKITRVENGKNAILSGQLNNVRKNAGIKTGNNHYKNGTGLFAMSDSKKKKVVVNGGKAAGKLAVENGTVSKAGKISAKSPNHVNNKILKCPHCKMQGAYPAMKRWHGENCKHKK